MIAKARKAPSDPKKSWNHVFLLQMHLMFHDQLDNLLDVLTEKSRKNGGIMDIYGLGIRKKCQIQIPFQ